MIISLVDVALGCYLHSLLHSQFTLFVSISEIKGFGGNNKKKDTRRLKLKVSLLRPLLKTGVVTSFSDLCIFIN